MLEILQFLFSDFWHWLGAYLMMGLLVGGFNALVGFVSARAGSRKAPPAHDYVD